MYDLEKKEGPGTGAWVALILGIAYALSPIDILPDVIPIAGWIDDFFIAGIPVLNFIQQKVAENNETLASLLGVIKHLVLIAGIIVILLIVLIGGLFFGIYKLV